MGLFLRVLDWKSGTCCQSLGWQGAAYTRKLQDTSREHKAQCTDIWGVSDTLPTPLGLLHALTPFAPCNKRSHTCTAGTQTPAARWSWALQEQRYRQMCHQHHITNTMCITADLPLQLLWSRSTSEHCWLQSCGRLNPCNFSPQMSRKHLPERVSAKGALQNAVKTGKTD